jgi:hypothetical protein
MMMIRPLGDPRIDPPLAGHDVLYWQSDVF